jgi:SET domain-containing protein
MKKQNLLLQLQHNTLIGLQPSATHGIGVFALVDIAQGADNLFSNDKSEWIKLTYIEVKALPIQSQALIENFCLYDDEGFFVPEYGFTMMDLSVYLNHSDMPNLISINDGEKFATTKDIKAGEELFVDYGTIVEE